MRSHQRAAAAIAAGRFDDEIVADPDARRAVGPRRRPRARRHERREARQAAPGLRQGRHAHRRQLERRSPTAPSAVLLMSEEKAKALGCKPLAAICVVVVRRRRSRRPAAHGTGARDAEGARPRRPEARRHRLRRHARGVRRAGAQRAQDARRARRSPAPAWARTRPSARSIRRSSTCTAARSRSATRSAPPARAWSRPWPTSSRAPASGRRCSASARPAASAPRPSSSASTDRDAPWRRPDGACRRGLEGLALGVHSRALADTPGSTGPRGLRAGSPARQHSAGAERRWRYSYVSDTYP